MKVTLDKSEIPGTSIKTSGDSLKDRRKGVKGGYDYATYNEAREAWEDKADWRNERARNYRQTYEDQWSDMVKNDRGKWVTEREYVREKTGTTVLQNNHLVTIPTTLTGLYTKSATQPTVYARTPNCDDKADMMTNALQANWKRTNQRELMTDRFLDLAVGGMAVVCEEWSVHEGVEDSYTFPVNPDYFLWKSAGNDPRGWDIYLIGEIRDSTLNDLAAELCSSRKDFDTLRKIYAPYLSDDMNTHSGGSDTQEDMNWEFPNNRQLCRTYRVWTKQVRHRFRCIDLENYTNPLFKIEESQIGDILAINEQRSKINAERMLLAAQEGVQKFQLLDLIKINPAKGIWDEYWHAEILGPNGIILDEYESPYEHGSHPYTYRMHNLVRGKIVPFISPVIDQQAAINKMWTLIYMSINSGIKGLKMIPSQLIPDWMSFRQFTKQAVENNGWVIYEFDDNVPAEAIKTINNNSLPVGAMDIMQTAVGWVKDITNVSGALQGQTPKSGTAYARYALETENSTTGLAALMQKFAWFETECAKKKLKTIHQYYTSPRNICNHHSTYASFALYDPQAVQDIEFDCNIVETADSPTSRAALNEFGQMLWEKGAISLQNFINRINLPGKDGYLQDINAAMEAQQAQYAQAQQGGGNMQYGDYFGQDNLNKIQQGSNPLAVNALQQALGVQKVA